MNIYVVSHYYDNGESYEDYREYETHEYYSTLELASSKFQQETCGEYEGQYELSKVELDTQETECIEKTDYHRCHSMLDDYFSDNPEDYMPDDYYSEDYPDAQAQLYDEIEQAYREAAGLTIFKVENWNPEWDHYCEDREKQITRIAHELADRYENLPVFGEKSWASLVYPFYDKYELNSDERLLFTQEYYFQHFIRYGHL